MGRTESIGIWIRGEGTTIKTGLKVNGESSRERWNTELRIEKHQYSKIIGIVEGYSP